MRYHRFAVLAVLSLLSPCLWALDVMPLKGTAATLHWDGQQFIQADARGDVFLLRGEPLEVYPLTKSHELGEPVRLDMAVSSGFPLDAAMSPDGNWAVNMGGKIHYFVDAHEVPLPDLAPGLKPLFVGFLRGDPVATVTPMPRGVASDSRGIPLLVRAANDSWSAEIREPRHTTDDPGMERAYRAAIVLDAREGRYVLAREYSYHIELRRLGRDRALEELRIGGSAPVLKKHSDAESTRLLAEVAAAAKSQAGGGTASVSPGRSALLALTSRGPGGPLYALVGAGIVGEQCALDRIDWDERRVERVSLNFPCKGRVSMAAGRDGLFFAEWNGQAGRYFVSWGALDEVKWTTVKEAIFTP
jgi:hypothetical protein